MFKLNSSYIQSFKEREDIPVNHICPIDQFDAEDFNQNESGWCRSDISKLARAQSLSEYDAIMKKIGQNPAQYNVTEDMTIQQAFDRVKPRNCQSPCELMRYVESLPYDSASLDDAYRKAVVSPEPTPGIAREPDSGNAPEPAK